MFFNIRQFVCVRRACVCVCERARACVRACVFYVHTVIWFLIFVNSCVCVCVCVRACVRERSYFHVNTVIQSCLHSVFVSFSAPDLEFPPPAPEQPLPYYLEGDSPQEQKLLEAIPEDEGEEKQEAGNKDSAAGQGKLTTRTSDLISQNGKQ